MYLCVLRQCLTYVCVPPLSKELEEFRHWWNTHVIRKNNQADLPSGVPNELYEFPSLHGMYM